MHFLCFSLLLLVPIVFGAKSPKVPSGKSTAAVSPPFSSTNVQAAPTFHLNQLNFVYSKAAKQAINGAQLREVMAAFKEFDREFLRAKKAQQSGKDPKGTQQLAVESHLRQYLQQRQMEDLLDDFNSKLNVANMPMEWDPVRKRKNLAKAAKLRFNDKSIVKLWQEAVALGLNDQELAELEQYLVKYDDLVAKYRHLTDESSATTHDKQAAFYHHSHKATSRPWNSNMSQPAIDAETEKIYAKAKLLNSTDAAKNEMNRLWQQANKVHFNQMELEAIRFEIDRLHTQLMKANVDGGASSSWLGGVKKWLGGAGYQMKKEKKLARIAMEMNRLESFMSAKAGHGQGHNEL